MAMNVGQDIIVKQVLLDLKSARQEHTCQLLVLAVKEIVFLVILANFVLIQAKLM
jgi:hypothetical protein